MEEDNLDIELLSKSLNSDVDHLEVLARMYDKYMETGNELSNLMRYYLNGLDEIPIQKVKSVWNEEAFNEQRKPFINSYPELLEILQRDHNSFKYNFRIITANEFNAIRFKEYPLWSEFYEYDELKEIEMWGYDKEFTLEELTAKNIESQHPYYTVPISSFPLKRMRYFTRSKFKTKNNFELDGVIMNEGELAIGIFIDDEIVTLSNHSILSSLMKTNLKKVATHFQIKVEDLKELEFETVIPKDNTNKIRGTWKNKKKLNN